MTRPRDVPPCDGPAQVGKVEVCPLVEEDLEWLWHWNVEVVDPQWKQWDGPYVGPVVARADIGVAVTDMAAKLCVS